MVFRLTGFSSRGMISERNRKNELFGETGTMKEKNIPGKESADLEFTMHARRSVEKVTQDPYFRDSDPEMILDALMNEIRSVSFGDYLKRYILRKKRGDPSADAGEEKDDVDYLCSEFRKKNVPPSFTPTSAKLRSLVKNWLQQQTVSRNVVLLLGFALDMSPTEVDEFLTKALRESRLDPKDPMEAVCWYCYRYRLPYPQFTRLWESFSSGDRDTDEDSSLRLVSTVRVRNSLESVRTEAQLAAYLDRLGFLYGSGRQSISARKQFDLLYRKVRELVAAIRTETERDDAKTNAGRYAEKLDGSDKLYDYQKRERVQRRREAYRTYQADEITPADIEDVLYAAVPKDRNGNMIPMKESLLNFQFSGKRLNRQHIREILDGKGVINRFDLITLSFFSMAGETDRYNRPEQRYDAFILFTNQVLKDSNMEPLYVANPFESFVMMCMLTDDPLGSFADVWELSYSAVQEEED